MFNDIYRKAVFFAGDIRRIHHFPWVTWDVHQHEVRMEEILEALPLIKYGDIGVHRDAGYLSNIAIPGFMKHAWIHTDDGTKKPMIVEAISEGVVHRSAVYPMYSDYTIILRPKGVDYKARRGACKKAKSIVGTRYDHDFKFDVEAELKHYKGDDTEQATQELGSALKYMQKFDHGFSCTEAVSYAWWHRREQLRIYREKSRGKEVILADSFINGGLDIVWASKSVTVDVAVKMGLHEEGVEMIRKFRS
jgi:hypothetical protein